MKTTIIKALAVALAVGASGPALADHRGFQNRLEKQHARIEQGVESGELTRREARKLYKEHRQLHRLTRELREDGRLSRREVHALNDAYDRASRHIYRLKHNDQTSDHWVCKLGSHRDDPAHHRHRHDEGVGWPYPGGYWTNEG